MYPKIYKSDYKVKARQCELKGAGAALGVGLSKVYVEVGTGPGQFSIWMNKYGIRLAEGSGASLFIDISNDQITLKHDAKIVVEAPVVEVNGTGEVAINAGVIKMNC